MGFLFACMLSHFSCVWLFATLWTVAHQAPLSVGFSRQEHWSGLPFLSPEDLPDPGIKPRSPALQASYLPAILILIHFSLTHFYSLVFILQPWQTPAGSPLITLFHSTGPLFMFSFCLSFQSTPFFTWLTYNHVDLQEASLIFFCSLTYFPFLHSHNT